MSPSFFADRPGWTSTLASICLLALAATLLPAVPVVRAASSWSPTLLVNTEAFQVIDDANASSNVSIKFGNTLNKSLIYDRTSSRFKFDAPLFVQGSLGVLGTMSGNAVYAHSAFSGAGLTNCSNGTTDKLLWDSATERFSCGTDQSGGGGGGLTQTQIDGLFVNQSGDAMTGGLLIKNGNGGSAIEAGLLLEVRGTASGDVVRAQSQLQASGSLVVEGAAAFQGGLTFGDAIGDAITVNAGAWTFSNDTNFVLSGGANGLSFDTNTLSIDASADRVGIGTTAPDSKLEVVGTASGDVLHAQAQLRSSGATVLDGSLTLSPSAAQSITAATNTIVVSAAMIELDPNADYTMTSAPTIADGVIGQMVIITADNTETNKVILQDQDTLASSNLQLGSTAREITAKKMLTLIFDGMDWVEMAYTTESADIRTYTAGANTWTKPIGAKAVYVVCVGGGGGGGGGVGNSAGTARIGGGGGGGGAKAERWILPADLAATETATVGAGGNGGNGNTGAAGGNGTAGGNSTFGAHLTCYGGGYGKGGITATVSAGGGGGGSAGAGSNGAAATNIGGLPAVTAGANGISGQGGGGNIGTNNGQAEYGGGGGNGSSATPGAAGSGGGSLYGAGGGGGGGGITTGNAARTAGAGGKVGLYTTAGGGAQGTSGATCTVGTAGTAGTSAKNGTGGGGGGSDTDTAGCAGGAGGALGGGGGGGGGGTNTGGAGGAGGRGEIRVYTFF